MGTKYGFYFLSQSHWQYMLRLRLECPDGKDCCYWAASILLGIHVGLGRAPDGTGAQLISGRLKRS